MPDTRARILSAAIRLFSRHGFSGTSTKDVAKLARVNEGTIFRQFGNKAGLYYATASTVVKRGLACIPELLAKRGNTPEGLLRTLIETLGEDPELLRTLNYAALEGTPEGRRVIREATAGIASLVEDAIRQQQAAGHVRADLPVAAAALTLTAIAYYHDSLFNLMRVELPDLTSDNLLSLYSEIWRRGAGQQPKAEPTDGNSTE